MVFVIPAVGTPGPTGPAGPAGPAGSAYAIGAKLGVSAPISIPATGLLIPWDVEVFDPNGFHTGSSPDFVIPAASGDGKYAVWVQLSMALGGGSPYFLDSNLRNNGTNEYRDIRANATTSSTVWTISGYLDLVIGDNVDVRMIHSSTTDPLDTLSGISLMSFSIQRVGDP